MEERQKRSGGIGDGIRTGFGILSAFKDAAEETLQEMVDRGDLTPERAKSTMREAVNRMQTSFEEAREKVDFAPRAEVAALRTEVAELRERLDRMEAGGRTDEEPPAHGGIIISE
ncbi:MAG TPA: hypothetical protein VFI91_13195 [Longimicrobiaceae bacterium]|nr:hypothetical protein [Longimicrobiaceae bacterium]